MTLTNISIETAGIIGFLGYFVVFLGLFLLMIVIILMGKIMNKRPVNGMNSLDHISSTSSTPKSAVASGTAGEIKLFDTDPKDAAIVMAVIAFKLGKPLNELRFKSIKEIKQK